MTMKNYDQSITINPNPNSPQIPDHPYRTVIIGCSGSDKTNVLLTLIKHQRPDIGEIQLCQRLFESKYQFLINIKEKVGIKKSKHLKAFLDYSQTIADVYETLEDYNPTKKREVLKVFDDMTADTECNKKN